MAFRGFRIADLLDDPEADSAVATNDPQPRLNDYIVVDLGIRPPDRRFRLSSVWGQFVIKIGEDVDYEETFLEIVKKCLGDLKRDLRRRGMVGTQFGAILNSPNLNSPVLVSWKKAEDCLAENLVAKFTKLQQSGATASLLGAPFSVRLSCLADYAGGAQHRLSYGDARIGTVSREGIFKNSSNRDHLCLFRAAMAAYYSESPHVMSRNRTREARRLEEGFVFSPSHPLKKLLDFCNVRISHSLFPLGTFAALIEAFFDTEYPSEGPFRLVVVERNDLKNGCIWPPVERKYDYPRRTLFLLHRQDHFDTIWKPKTFFNCHDICVECRFTGKWIYHRSSCPVKCRLCNARQKEGNCAADENPENHRRCESCGCFFKNLRCFERHKLSACRLYIQCRKCEGRYRARERSEHVCGRVFCLKCRVRHSPEQPCFIQAKSLPTESPKVIYAIYDLETTQEFPVGDAKQHWANFASVVVACNECFDAHTWEDGGCTNCGSGRQYFSHPEGDPDPALSLVKFFFDLCRPKVTVICAGHYAGHFDLQLLLTRIMEYAPYKTPNIINNGNKIFRFSIKGGVEFRELRFIDTHNFIPMSLAKAHSALGLPDNIAEKGYFPHLFNKMENYGKVLPHLPPKEDYLCEGFLPSKREQFDKWYSENYNSEFSLTEQIRSYGNNDTLLLAHIVYSYRKMTREITKMEFDDVFYSSTTLAGSTLLQMRTLHWAADTIAVIPHGGYGREDRQSEIGCKYLKYYAWKENKPEMRHKDSGGEYKIPETGFFVDGYCEAERLVVEVAGCYWHGCPDCFSDRDKMLPIGKTPRQLLTELEKRVATLEELGYSVIVKWECDIRKELKRDSEMSTYFKECRETSALKIEHAFMGGRTSVFKVWEVASAEREISYADVQSLYPSVLYYDPMPVGVPNRIVKSEAVCWRAAKDIPYGDGIHKVFLIPPQNLKIPVLPMRLNGGLFFPLCKKCAETGAEKRFNYRLSCAHSEEDRGWVATLTSVELKFGLDRGYAVTHHYETLEWESWSAALFKDFVSSNLKVKLEASGPDSSLDTPEKKAKFLDEIQKRYGFRLDESKWEKNAGLRTIAKLRLNTSWGKLSQSAALPKLAICRNHEDIAEIFRNEANKVKSIEVLTDDIAYVHYAEKDQYIEPNHFTNLAIAAHVTAYGRIRLYRFIEECCQNGGTPLYCDTDSLIYSHSVGSSPVTLGLFLGTMEKEHSSSRILEFASGGGKQYVLKMKRFTSDSPTDPQLETEPFQYDLKLRGFSLNSGVQGILNEQSFRRIVLGMHGLDEEEWDGVPIAVRYEEIRPQIEGTVFTVPRVKRYIPTYNRAYLAEDNLTFLPYGYRSEE